MFAGSDFLLMPSPRAQRFGLLPIARKTGGLADSIEDGLTGSLFRAMSVDGCLEAVVRALNVFGNSEISWPCGSSPWHKT